MKVIDLLKKIENGENIPQKIKVYQEIFEWDILEHYYRRSNGDDLLELCTIFNTGELLSMEVELIEDEIDIENMKKYATNQAEDIITKTSTDNETEKELRNYIVNNTEDISELIQAVKQLNKKVKEMSADEMFEELGYEKTKVNEYWIIYKNLKKDIDFNLKHKTIEVENQMQSEEFNMQELQAINKKVEELGWK